MGIFWRRRTARWLIDPSNVIFGSVVDKSSRNLSRSHVKVKYQHEPEALFVPLATFVRRCLENIQGGRPLDIEQLLVAPIVRQRHARFFDHLTDWGPAVRHARASSPGRGATERERSIFSER